MKEQSSSEVMQEDTQPQEPSESMDSSGTINGLDGDLDEQDPFGNNEFFNYAWLNNIQIPDNLYPQDANPHPLSPPRLTHFTFRWQEILDGTQNLHNTNLLGRGNSCSEVYLCDFPRFDKVGAAKIQDLQDGEAHPEFVAEIKALHRAYHPNVITLLGKCVNREHCVIVHEFMPKGSLDHYLFGVPRQAYPVLDWDTRMRIAVGVAEALVYVHDELKMIHRDVRASKVLLDEDFEPKLTGFGLATRIVENEHGVEQQTEISRIKGSQGCIAPETERFGLVSSKSDVYSYGVFLLTLFTGRKAFDLETLGWARKLTNWLVPVLSREECMPLVVDVALAYRFSVEGLVRLFHVARMCMDQEVVARPNMRLVELMVRQAGDYEVLECPPVTRRCSI